MEPSHSTDWMLVVEDQPDLWFLLKAYLQPALPQVELVHFSSPLPAITYLQTCSVEKQLPPRMVLSDLYLPHLEDGLSFLSSLKASTSSYRHLPVVIISSSTHDQDRQEVNRRGGTFQAKPITAEEWSEFSKTIHHYWHKSGFPGEGRQHEHE